MIKIKVLLTVFLASVVEDVVFLSVASFGGAKRVLTGCQNDILRLLLLEILQK